MADHQAVAVAAGKYRTAVATTTGNVYAWDGEGNKADLRPSPVRVHGAKHVTRLSVGETHSLAVASLYAPTFSTKPVNELPAVSKATGEGEDSADEDTDMEEESETLGAVAPSRVDEGVPSLKDLCQKVVADSIVEPKNALQLLEFADSLGADHLKRYCEVKSSYFINLFNLSLMSSVCHAVRRIGLPYVNSDCHFFVVLFPASLFTSILSHDSGTCRI
jgi:hypothetical protein